MKLQITSAARRDLVEAYEWYEAKVPGLGQALITAVDVVFNFIQQHPSLPRTIMRNLRRVHTRRFPYAIYYEIQQERAVRIVAVFHTARDRRNLTFRGGEIV